MDKGIRARIRLNDVDNKFVSFFNDYNQSLFNSLNY